MFNEDGATLREALIPGQDVGWKSLGRLVKSVEAHSEIFELSE